MILTGVKLRKATNDLFRWFVVHVSGFLVKKITLQRSVKLWPMTGTGVCPYVVCIMLLIYDAVF